MPNYNTWKIIGPLFSLVVFKTKKNKKQKTIEVWNTSTLQKHTTKKPQKIDKER